MEKERWLPIIEYEGFYDVSSYGRVRRVSATISFIRAGKAVNRFVEGRIMQQVIHSISGYPFLNLSKGGVRNVVFVHRLVAEAFHGPCPAGLQCAHLDGSRDNSHYKNLKWVTAKENQNHKNLHGTSNTGEQNPRSLLTKDDVIKIRKRRAAGEIYREIAEDYDIDYTTVYCVVKGKNWGHVKEGL